MRVPTFTSITPPPGILSGGLDKVIALIQAGIGGLLVITIILAFIFLVIGGMKWITSQGDKQGLASAKGTVTYAIIGLVLAFLCFGILRFISEFFNLDLINP